MPGRQVAKADLYGTTSYIVVDIQAVAGKITANFDSRPMAGDVNGETVHLATKAGPGNAVVANGWLVDGTPVGEVVQTDSIHRKHAFRHPFAATRPTKPRPGPLWRPALHGLCIRGARRRGAGAALETSMNVEFTVQVIHGKKPPEPGVSPFVLPVMKMFILCHHEC